MVKGFRRSARALLAGALLLLALSPARSAPDARPDRGPAWWSVHLTVSLEGEYRLGSGAAASGGKTATGTYAYRARWEGRLEPDEDDFLLVHLKTEVLEWRLTERTGAGDHMTLVETTDVPAPDLRLNYVLRDGKAVAFDFGLDGAVTVPLLNAAAGTRLSLPRTAAPPESSADGGYDAGLTRGSNRVVLPAEDLARRRAERTFSWEWETAGPRTGAPRGFSDRHAVKAVVALAMR
jgi:hypothetical protein